MAGEQILRHLHARRRRNRCVARTRARDRHRGRRIDRGSAPSLPNAWLARKKIDGPYRRARVTISFPVANVGANLATLAAVVAGNLYDLGEVTGLRLDTIRLPAAFATALRCPSRASTERAGSPALRRARSSAPSSSRMSGMSADETAALVARLCAAGLDFIKDDEICADPEHAPLAARMPAVMAAVRAHQDKTGKSVMVAFNITDETDAMRRHADLIAREGGTCAMVSLNWCGFSAVADAAARRPISRCMATATASARCRAIRCSALLPGLSDALASRRRRSHACPRRAGKIRAGGRRGGVVGARLRHAADRRRR